jgi:hypothetical protein
LKYIYIVLGALRLQVVQVPTDKQIRRHVIGETKKLPSSAFALRRSRQYRINTPDQARHSLRKVAEFGTPAEKEAVRSAVRRKYPNIEVSE